MTFRDGTKQWEVAMDSISDRTRYVTPHADVTLDQFMARPVLTRTYVWTPGVTPFTQTISPWQDFFNNKRNVNRINNYKILNAKLHVKIVINGNPFYYGRLMADYLPLNSYDAVTPTSLTDQKNAILASQRLHGFINPTTSQGLHLELPFLWPENGFDLVNDNFNNIGLVFIRELAPLKHANGAATPITINVFCWAEDLVLSIPTTEPTTGLVPQTSEMDMKPSTIMSTVAYAAGLLSKVPIIGPYAMATSMVTGALGKVAKLFGFSRPAVIDEASAMRPALIGELAVTDKKENLQRLVADSRQELTIDPSIIGVKLPDELSIKYIAGKESFVTNFPWTTAKVEGDILFNIRVCPSVYDYTAPNYYMTASCFAGLPFKYWRGTMKYRFQIVCSQYHKGRLLFLYDPGYIKSIETNIVYSRIVDLENERDFTIDVAWSQPKAFLPTASLVTTPVFSTSAYVTADTAKNGVLGVYVLNELNSPNSTINNDISINVFASACEDIDFAVPYADNIRGLAWATQTEEMEMESAPTNMESKECMSECIEQDHNPLVFFGEKFTSFRSLLKRYNFLSTISTGPPSAAGNYVWLTEVTDFPASRGTTPTGGINALGLANYTSTTLLNYLAPAFLASRGSIRYKKIIKSDVTSNAILTVIRGFTGVPQNVLTLRSDATIDAAAKQAADATFPSFSVNASAVTSNVQQPCIEYELPYYRPYRFDVAKDPFGRAAITRYAPVLNVGHLTSTEVKFSATTDRASIDTYVSVGEDFQLMLYQGPPLAYIYTIP